MEYGLLVFLVLAHFGTAYFEMYAYDGASPEISGEDMSRLRQPDLTDLKGRDPASNTAEWHYVWSVICPAYRYFKLRSELISLQNKHTATEALLIPVGIQTASIASIYRLCLQIGILTQHLFSVLIIATVGCLGCFMVSKIYKRVKIPEFTQTSEKLRARFMDLPSLHTEHNISFDVALNNYIILQHLLYLDSVIPSVRKRAFARETMWYISLISLFIFGLIYRSAY